LLNKYGASCCDKGTVLLSHYVVRINPHLQEVW
jgi:hypothetical protein